MPGEIAFGWDTFENVIAEPNFRDLIEQQWRELSSLPDPPEPDFARALALEAAGGYRLWTGRRDGELVAFIQWQFLWPIGYRGMQWACDAGWYLDRAKCDRGAAIRLWRSALEAVRAMNISVVRGHDNAKRPLGPLFKRLGFVPVSTMYQRVL